mmetsp:Transcript_46193/g.80786  ORF Transcript_46193/g.80786 Transcript_46193/m.80786 type:complete len:366 (-) Transcript_46193:87-1184(-)
MYRIVVFTLLLLFGLTRGKNTLDLCKANEDTYGTWNLTSSVNLREVGKYFVNGVHGHAAQFDKMWFPANCSYLRFTNTSLKAVAAHIIASGKSNSKDGKLHLLFMGDSGLRGALCGIGRILSGNEIHGPNINDICGYNEALKPRARAPNEVNLLYSAEFDNIVITFMYIMKIEIQATGWMLEMNVHKQPYALILNTGAWSFNEVARVRSAQYVNSTENCDSPEDLRIEAERNSPSSRAVYAECGELGFSLNVKMVYRTSHYNSRFGFNCADAQLIPFLETKKWNIWDNSRISRNVWKTQNHDGFHYDRIFVHNVTEHKEHIKKARELQIESPGMLEMQLAHSLLHFLFRDTVQEFLDQGIHIPLL